MNRLGTTDFQYMAQYEMKSILRRLEELDCEFELSLLLRTVAVLLVSEFLRELEEEPAELTFEVFEEACGKKVDMLGVVGLLLSWSLSAETSRGFLADSLDTSETLEWEDEQADEVPDEQDSTLAILADLTGVGLCGRGDSAAEGFLGKGGVEGGDTDARAG